MSEDHIKRSDAIEVVSISCRMCLARDIEDCKKCSVPRLRELINAIPSADRPQGEWIEHKERTIVRNDNFVDFFPTEYECSNCGLRRATYFINSPLSNYCPNCGARMKGAGDE